MARRAAGRLAPPGPDSASGAWRAAAGAAGADDGRGARTYVPSAAPEPLAAWEPADDDLRGEAEAAVGRGARGRPPAAGDEWVADVDAEAIQAAARGMSPAQRTRTEARLRDASRAFRNERYGDAARMLKALADQAPGAAAVRELYGLTLYRQGKWRLAAKELEAFRALSASVEQHPVLADCYRALRRWNLVDELWEELREASPSAELVTEGRIVAAGALADRRRLPEAIALLEQGWRFPKRPREHHLRRAYALADLYERAGEVPRARELFGRVAQADPDFADVVSRVRALR